MLLLVAGLAGNVLAATSQRILVLSTDPHGSPGLLDFELSLRRVLTDSMQGRVEVDIEHLDTVYSSSPEIQRTFADLFRAKYASREHDLVIPVGVGALQFATAERQELFPHAPILFSYVQQSDLNGLVLTNVAGLVTDMQVGEQIRTALRLLPKTRRAVVILGSGPVERGLEPTFRRDIGRFSNQLDITWWVGLPMPVLEKRIAQLPADTVVVLLGIYRDDSGESFLPILALEHLAKYSNAPIFGSPAAWNGHGIVGDGRWSMRETGLSLGASAVRLLRGETAAAVGISVAPPATPAFDARQLERWKIPRHLLPPGSEILFEEPSLWKQHRTALLIGLAVMAAQTALLVAFILQRIARRRAERGAHESRTLYAAVADSLDERIATLDHDGTIVAANRSWRSFAKAHGEEGLSVGSNYVDTVKRAMEAGREDARMTLESLTSVLSGRVPSRTLSYASPGNGERWHYEMRVVALQTPASGALVTIQDITDRWRSEERVRVALESLPVATFLVDGDGRIELLNKEAERLFSYPRHELLGHSIETVLPDCSQRIERWLESDATLERDSAEEELDRNVTGRRRDGSSTPVAVHLRPISMASRRVMLVSVLDLSERRRVETEMQKLRDETAHFGRVAAVGEMSAAIAHELNQPLTGIMTNCQAAQRFIERGTLSVRDMNELFSDIVADARRAGEVIQRLRLMLRKAPVEVKLLDINETVQQVVRVVGHDLALRGSALDLELTEDLPRVTGDRIHLQQVILNLVLNGADAMSQAPVERRRMRLRTMPGINSTVELELRDNGPGLSPEAMAHLFEPFFTTKPNGMGMGLSIVRSIVETHGGSIKCNNAASGGAVFTVVLPAATENQAA